MGGTSLSYLMTPSSPFINTHFPSPETHREESASWHSSRHTVPFLKSYDRNDPSTLVARISGPPPPPPPPPPRTVTRVTLSLKSSRVWMGSRLFDLRSQIFTGRRKRGGWVGGWVNKTGNEGKEKEDKPPTYLPVRSYEAVSTVLPSWLKTTALIICVWPVNFRSTRAVPTSQRKKTRSPPTDANRELSFL